MPGTISAITHSASAWMSHAVAKRMTTRRKLGTVQLQLCRQAEMVRRKDAFVPNVGSVESDLTFSYLNRRININIVNGHVQRRVLALLRQTTDSQQGTASRMAP